MRYILTAILSLIYTATLAQQHGKSVQIKKPSPKEIIQNAIAEECSFTNKYSKAERRHLYPFNRATGIMLVSFKEGQNIPVKSEIIDTQKVLEQVRLNTEQTDSLTSLLYNVGFTPVNGVNPFPAGYNCYEPRNGILFIDATGKAFEYLEICFACMRTEKSSALINDGQYCSTKYELLRNFFNTAGIKYGTGEREPALTYKEIFQLDTAEAVSAIRSKIAKKTKDGKDLSLINEGERTLFFTINSDQIYDGFSGLSGLAHFYLTNSGDFYKQTRIGLKKIGAYRTLEILEASKLQWPERRIPEDLPRRRAVLLKMINAANPQWQKLESGLFDYQDEVGARVFTPKEDLTALIFKFATLHRDELTD